MADAKKKILIVEDSKSYLWILSQSFIGEGFTVVSAENGEDGLVVAEKEKPDIILTDITMPKMEGTVMAEKIKKLGISAPIIFLTNMNDLDHISDATKSSKDYIVKADVSVDDIVNMVKRRLDLKYL